MEDDQQDRESTSLAVILHFSRRHTFDVLGSINESRRFRFGNTFEEETKTETKSAFYLDLYFIFDSVLASWRVRYLRSVCTLYF